MTGTNPWAYLFALAPLAVVLAIVPVLGFLPGPGVGPLWVAGPPGVLAGLGLAGWTVRSFARAGASPSPATRPATLVTEGSLAHSRNPLYLGTVVAAGGTGLTVDSAVAVAYAGLLWLAYHLLVVFHEEPALRAAFDEAYEQYCERVPRWL